MLLHEHMIGEVLLMNGLTVPSRPVNIVLTFPNALLNTPAPVAIPPIAFIKLPNTINNGAPKAVIAVR